MQVVAPRPSLMWVGKKVECSPKTLNRGSDRLKKASLTLFAGSQGPLYPPLTKAGTPHTAPATVAPARTLGIKKATTPAAVTSHLQFALGVASVAREAMVRSRGADTTRYASCMLGSMRVLSLVQLDLAMDLAAISQDLPVTTCSGHVGHEPRLNRTE
eukprot:566442-Pelagomonas_calceolata.AAC.10